MYITFLLQHLRNVCSLNLQVTKLIASPSQGSSEWEQYRTDSDFYLVLLIQRVCILLTVDIFLAKRILVEKGYAQLCHTACVCNFHKLDSNFLLSLQTLSE